MKKLTLFLMCFCFIVFNAMANEAQFIEGFEDVPLYKNAKLIEEKGINFDTVDGKIVEVYLEVADSFENLKTFYRESLVELGWQYLAEGRKYIKLSREGENIDIKKINKISPLIVRITVKSDIE